MDWTDLKNRLVGSEAPPPSPPAAYVEPVSDALTMTPRIERWRDEVRHSVEGWVGDRTHDMIAVIDRMHRCLKITGDIAEIGVHHGMFLLLLAAVRQTDQRVIGMDLFEAQAQNVDGSGHGAREIAAVALERSFPGEMSAIDLVSVDSLELSALNIRDYLPRPVRLFSVDGGHTREHVINDLSLAQLVVCNSGVVVLDDFFGPHWPSVTDGYYAFMASHNRRLAPFLFFQNKLYLTTISDHQTLSELFSIFLAEHLGEEMNSVIWKYVTLSGYSVLARASPT